MLHHNTNQVRKKAKMAARTTPTLTRQGDKKAEFQEKEEEKVSQSSAHNADELVSQMTGTTRCTTATTVTKAGSSQKNLSEKIKDFLSAPRTFNTPIG